MISVQLKRQLHHPLNGICIDLTSAPKHLSKFSPYFPYGNIPVPHSSKKFKSIYSAWKSLNVNNKSGNTKTRLLFRKCWDINNYITF